MKKYCLTLVLKNDRELIEKYEFLHQAIPSGIDASIRQSGILEMEIYRFETRLCMTIEVDENFSFEKKSMLDKQNPEVEAWENLMWDFQKEIIKGKKWIIMEKIFSLNKS